MMHLSGRSVRHSLFAGLSLALLMGSAHAGSGQGSVSTLAATPHQLLAASIGQVRANVMDAILQEPTLKGFAELLQITNLQDYVRKTPITVFAPRDPSCAVMLKEARQWKAQNNQRKLAEMTQTVKHHLLRGKYMWRAGTQKDVILLSGDRTEMVSGLRLAVYPNSSGGTFTIQVSNSKRARMVKQDIVTGNGILFIIDRPLDAHSVRFD